MSADNWAPCPSCKRIAQQQREIAAAKAEAGYGTLPIAEYEELRILARKPAPETTTMREDYQLGVDDDGGFSVWYHAQCESCGFDYSYEFKEQALR